MSEDISRNYDVVIIGCGIEGLSTPGLYVPVPSPARIICSFCRRFSAERDQKRKTELKKGGLPIANL